MKKGRLTAIYGPMFSGKTTYLIEKFGDGYGAVVFKPDLDVRYSKQPAVISHDSVEIPSVLVNNDKPEEMQELVGSNKVVFIDEVNLFTPKLVKTVEDLLNRGIDVYAAGLTIYANGGQWEPMVTLVRMSDVKVELTARCDGEEGKCKEPATRSYRKIASRDKISVAGAEEYGAACEKHYLELHHKPRGRK